MNIKNYIPKPLLLDHYRSLIRVAINNKWYLGILSSFFLGLLIFYAYFVPVSYDEATTFNFFVNQGFLVSISYYPAPNNHILYSSITSIINHLPLSSNITLRILAIIGSLLSFFFSHHILYRLYNREIAILGSLVLMCLPGFLNYSFLARGYSLTVLFFILGFYSVIQILRKERSFFYILTTCSILGLYTMPSFLYSFLALDLYLIYFLIKQKRKYDIIYWGISNFMILGIVLLLYLPIIYFSGIDSLVGNRFVESINRIEVLHKLYAHLNSTIGFLLGIPFPYFIIILGIIHVFIKQQKGFLNHSILLALFSLYIPPLIILLHSVVPFERTWLYLSFPMTLVFSEFYSQIGSYFKKFIKICVFLFFGYIFFNFNLNIKEIYNYEFMAESMADIAIDKGKEKVLTSDPILNRTINYSLKSRGYQIQTGVQKSCTNLDKNVLFISEIALNDQCSISFFKKIDSYYLYL